MTPQFRFRRCPPARTSQLSSSRGGTLTTLPSHLGARRPVCFNRSMPADDELERVNNFLRRWNAVAHKQKHCLAKEIPLSDMQIAAGPSPGSVGAASVSVLPRPLCKRDINAHISRGGDDPVTPVRELALHGLACEQCRAVELCVADVVPVLRRVIESDTSADVRHKAIPILLRLSGHDARARADKEVAASSDDDPLVRQVALAALEGRYRDALRSRHDLLRRSRTRKGKTVASQLR